MTVSQPVPQPAQSERWDATSRADVAPLKPYLLTIIDDDCGYRNMKKWQRDYLVVRFTDGSALVLRGISDIYGWFSEATTFDGPYIADDKARVYFGLMNEAEFQRKAAERSAAEQSAASEMEQR